MKKVLEKRLVYLYSGELSSIIVFIPVSYLLNYTFPNLRLYSLYSFWVSFFLLEFLLVQGTMYWYAKLKRLRDDKSDRNPIKIFRMLHRLKTLNIVIILIASIAFAFDFNKWYPSYPLGGLSIAFFIYVFAILEFINYFYIQISYDNISEIKNLLKSRKLKISSMNKDFKRMRKLKP